MLYSNYRQIRDITTSISLALPLLPNIFKNRVSYVLLFSPITEKELKEVIRTQPGLHKTGSVLCKTMFLKQESSVISKLFCTYTHSGKEIMNTDSNIKLLLCIFHTVIEWDKVNLSRSSNMVPTQSHTHGIICRPLHMPLTILKDYTAAL